MVLIIIKRFRNKFSINKYNIDAFLQELQRDYTQCFIERNKAAERLETLAAIVDDYKAQEDEIKSALIVAQRTAGAMESILNH